MAKATPIPVRDIIVNSLRTKANILNTGVTNIINAGTLGAESQALIQSQIFHENIESLTDATLVTSNTQTVTGQILNSTKGYKVIANLQKGLDQAEFDVLNKLQAQNQLLQSQIPEWALRQNQEWILKPLKALFKTGGVLATGSANPHYLDANQQLDGDVLTQISTDSLGENSDELSTVFVHRDVYDSLFNRLIFVNATEFGSNILATGQIATLRGKRIIVNNTLCTPYDDNGTTKYPCYLASNNSLVLEVANNITLEEDYNARKGFGTTEWTYKWRIAPYVANTTYNTTTEPSSEADYEDATKWSLAGNHELVKVAKVDVIK